MTERYSGNVNSGPLLYQKASILLSIFHNILTSILTCWKTHASLTSSHPLSLPSFLPSSLSDEPVLTSRPPPSLLDHRLTLDAKLDGVGAAAAVDVGGRTCVLARGGLGKPLQRK